MSPERVSKLVLLNGAHGQLMHSMLQPLFRVPMLGDSFHHVVALLRRFDNLLALAKHITLSYSFFSRVFLFKVRRPGGPREKRTAKSHVSNSSAAFILPNRPRL